MKQLRIKIFYFLGIFLFIICLNAVFASGQLTTSCPVKFIGKVIKIQENQAPSSFQKLNITFKVEKIIRGDLKDYTTIKVLRDGRHKFRIDQLFNIELRKNLICSIHKFDIY